MSPPTDSTFVPDLDGYFARIGYAGSREPTLAVLDAITFAHAAAIPFENGDVLLGKGISLDPAVVERKLVHERRGGYCFEQNGHLLRVLQALGFEVTPLGARVRWQRPRDVVPPRTHLFLQVTIEGAPWFTDVGTGGLSLTSAVPFDGSGRELTTRHESRRYVCEDGRWFHQVRIGQEWQDVYEFTGEIMHPIDCEVANWFTSAHPLSHFRTRLMVARATADGRVTLLNDEVTRRRGTNVETVRIRDADALLEVLREDFGLTFPAGTRFGPPGSPWPS